MIIVQEHLNSLVEKKEISNIDTWLYWNVAYCEIVIPKTVGSDSSVGHVKKMSLYMKKKI